jgi:hypothetical protein
MGKRQHNKLFKAIRTLFSDIREMDVEDDLLADTEMRMTTDFDGNPLIAIEYDGAGYEYLNHASPLDSRARLEKLAIDHGFTLEDQNKWSCVLYLE